VNSTKASEEFVQYHKDGSVLAQGQVIGDIPTGYWGWFWKDGKKGSQRTIVERS
jgi:hypothetical protein